MTPSVANPFSLRIPVLLLLITLLPVCGCTRRSAQTDSPAVPFAVPPGWSIVPAKSALDSNGDLRDTTIRLRDASGACRIQFSRTSTPLSLAQWQADLSASFNKGGHPAEPQPAMSLGGVPAAHLFLKFPGNVIEQVYAMRSGDWLLTLVTVHAALCKDNFQSTLDSFRA